MEIIFFQKWSTYKIKYSSTSDEQFYKISVSEFTGKRQDAIILFRTYPILNCKIWRKAMSVKKFISSFTIWFFILYIYMTYVLFIIKKNWIHGYVIWFEIIKNLDYR